VVRLFREVGGRLRRRRPPIGVVHLATACQSSGSSPR
jgi:hypothetical protein